MKRIELIWCLIAIAVSTGCSKAEPANHGSNVFAENQQPAGHTHVDGDKLFWPTKGLEYEGFLLWLGHHGNHFHAGDTIEPAVMITRGGAFVEEARVFNSLVSEDGQTVLAEEVGTVLEAESVEEPAHFAQGELVIPKDVTVFQIRFRIELPDVAQPFVADVRVEGH